MQVLPPAPAPEIVVTGRGLEAAAGDAAYDIVSIDRARLAGSASGRLEDVLRDVAGFAQYRRSDARSAQPTSQGATLRGLGGNASSRALVLLDGVPQVDPFGGWISFPAFDPLRLARVSVTRGGGSGVNGPGALAGTIALESVGPEDANLGAQIAYGQRDSIDAHGGAVVNAGGGYGSAFASYARGDGFIPTVREDRGPIDRRSPYEQASVALRGVAPLGGSAELQASGLVFTDRRERGTPFTPNSNTGGDASLRVVGRGAWGYEALAYLQVRRFTSGFASIDDRRSTATATLDQFNVPATGAGGRFELRPPVGERVELRLGGDVRRVTGSTNELFSYVAGNPTRRREAGGDNLTTGAFAEATLRATDSVTLTGGGRIDRWRIGGGRLQERLLSTSATVTDLDFADRSGWEPTARAGVAWRPAGAILLRAAGYTGWRLPTLNELYRPYRVGADAVAADAGLSPERVAGVDGGFDYRPLPGFRLGATYFWNRLRNAIANITIARGPGTFPQVGFVSAAGAFRRRGNLDAVRSRGVELEAEARHGAMSLTASYAHVDARVEASGVAAPLDRLRPAQTAPDQASATLAWAPAAGPSAAATLRYVAAQYDDDQNSRRLDDAVTLDGVVRLPLTTVVSVSLRAENLTNARVEAGTSGNDIVERATPRTLWAELRFGF